MTLSIKEKSNDIIILRYAAIKLKYFIYFSKSSRRAKDNDHHESKSDGDYNLHNNDILSKR